jgi:tRNA/rRNA methyltransferase
VAVYAFALRGGPAAPPRGAGAGPAAADDAELLAVEEALRSALAAGGFLRGPERHAVRDLSRTLRRGRLTRKEARLWVAALRRVARREPT